MFATILFCVYAAGTNPAACKSIDPLLDPVPLANCMNDEPAMAKAAQEWMDAHSGMKVRGWGCRMGGAPAKGWPS